MTLLNIERRRARILIVTDSAIEQAAGPRAANNAIAATAKCVLLPHIDAAIAGRGSAVFFGAMAQALLLAGPEFDHCAEKFAEACDATWRALRADLRRLGWGALEQRQQIVLAGYSRRAGCMRAYAATKRDGAAFDVAEIDRFALAPAEAAEEIGGAPNFETDAGIRALARAQRHWAEKVGRGDAIGGVLILTAIEPGRGEQRRLKFEEN